MDGHSSSPSISSTSDADQRRRRERPTTVLIADGESAARAFAAALLEESGYRTLAAGDGDSALLIAAQQEPDVVVIDIGLPSRGGLELVRRLSGEARAARPPIVLLIAADGDEDVSLGFEAGADDYLKKPLIAGELRARVAAALARAHRLSHLIDTARTDQLTGLPNRRAWDEQLPRDLAHARGTGQPLCLALLDLDRFKRFNDEHGHPAGDRLLREVATAWTGCVRETDLLVRYGGEEFGLVLRGTGLDGAHVAVERLRAAVPPPHTCSAGLACWNVEESVEALVLRADRALYAAKAAGRDRLTIAEPAPAGPRTPPNTHGRS
jgi:diguanylate cyclase (GGDEF)-like protein